MSWFSYTWRAAKFIFTFYSLIDIYSAVAIAFRFAKNNEKAKIAFEKASKGQEMLSSYPFSALS